MTNIISSQSKSPPPLLPPAGGLLAVTVSVAEAVPELLPAGAVESALAAIELV